MSVWEQPGRLEEALRLQAEGLTFAQIAGRMNLNRMQVGNKLRRVAGIEKPQKPRVRQDRAALGFYGQWTDAVLTERWVDRKARLARERAELRP